MSNVATHSSSSRSSNALMPTSTGPAAFTSAVQRAPAVARPPSNAASTSSTLREVGLQRDRVGAAERLERADRLVERASVRAEHRDPRPFRGQALRRRAAHALRAAAHDDRRTGEPEVHASYRTAATVRDSGA